MLSFIADIFVPNFKNMDMLSSMINIFSPNSKVCCLHTCLNSESILSPIIEFTPIYVQYFLISDKLNLY